MKTGSVALTTISTVKRTRKAHKADSRQALDVMVAAVGLTVSLAGFFSGEITWYFTGA